MTYNPRDCWCKITVLRISANSRKTGSYKYIFSFPESTLFKTFIEAGSMTGLIGLDGPSAKSDLTDFFLYFVVSVIKKYQYQFID